MPRPLTLFNGQWSDLSLDALCRKARAWGYEGIEIECFEHHFSVRRALDERGYCAKVWATLQKHGLGCWAIGNHLAGQAVCDLIDARHRAILPPHVWGDGAPEGVRRRAADEMKATARAARRFFRAAPADVKRRLTRVVVNGFTGSSIWPFLYSFPPVPKAWIDAGFQDFADRWRPILNVFSQEDVDFALEVHPTEIAFDLATTERALDAVKGHARFGFNYDPSHLGYQGADYAGFIREFGRRIFHVHVKDVHWSKTPARAGVFGGHLDFGHPDRFWDFRSPGHGSIDFEVVMRGLNGAGYAGPLSVEWEDNGMDREHGAREAAAFVRKLDFAPAATTFDAGYDRRAKR